MSLTQSQLRGILTQRILALVPLSTYADVSLKSDGSRVDSWREATEPLLQESGPETWMSLDFFVEDRDQEDDGGRSADTDMVAQVVVVRFVYEVNPNDKKTSWDKAGMAAEHLRSWLRAGRGDWYVGIHVGPASGSRGPRIRRIPVVRAEAVTEESLEYRLTHVAVEIPLRVTYDTLP